MSGMTPIGKGSFASVYKLVDSTGTFAIKTGEKRIIQAEYDMLKYLECKVGFASSNIIKIFEGGIGEFYGKRLGFLKLELHEMTLFEHVTNQGGSLSLEKTARITKEVTKALLFLSDQNIIHADVKPENVLITGDRVVLVDFGHSKRADRAEPESYIQTRWYRSPEVVLGIKPTVACDVWSLAVMSSEIYIGNCFTADSEDDLPLFHQLRLRRYYPEDLIKQGSRDLTESTKYVREHFQDERFESLKDVIKKEVDVPMRGDAVVQKERFFDLLDKMLDFSPESRMRPREILEHPFLGIREDVSSNGLETIFTAITITK